MRERTAYVEFAQPAGDWLKDPKDGQPLDIPAVVVVGGGVGRGRFVVEPLTMRQIEQIGQRMNNPQLKRPNVASK